MSEIKIKILRLTDDEEKNANSVLHAAIYARYSSIGNSPYSADEQIQRIRYRVESGQIRSRRFPDAKIIIDEKWVIKDEAKTGRVTNSGLDLVRQGTQAKKFNMVLGDDWSRFARDLGGLIDLYDDFVFYQVEGFSVADNISSFDENARDLFVFKGYANEHQSKATSKNTIRGLELRALGGFSTGHNPYGYYSSATKTAMIKNAEKPSHFEIKVDAEKAQVILRIWSLYADGLGFRSIASILNKEGIPSPGGRGRSRHSSKRWAENSISNILKQEKYIGLWKYRMTKVVKNPTIDKLAQQQRPKSEWLVSEREDLRIVPKDLENRVKARQAQIAVDRRQATTKEQRIFGVAGNPPSHLFTGITHCGLCGGNMILVSGKSGGYIGCGNAHRQTTVNCENKQMVLMAWVEANMVDELRKHLECPETYSRLAKKYNELMSKRHSDVPKRIAEIEGQIIETQKALSNYDRFIRSGNRSEMISSSLSVAEKKLKDLTAERSHLNSQVDGRVYITPGAIKERMAQVGELLADKVIQANGVLRRVYPEGVRMLPQGIGRKRFYEASGAINLQNLIRFTSVVSGGPERGG